MCIERETNIMGVQGKWYFTGTPISQQRQEGWKFKLMKYSRYKKFFSDTFNSKGYTQKLGYHPDTKMCIVMIPPGKLQRRY